MTDVLALVDYFTQASSSVGVLKREEKMTGAINFNFKLESKRGEQMHVDDFIDIKNKILP